MFFSPSKNTIFINSYTILIDAFIGFTAFAIFFGVFANYYYEHYLESLVLADLRKALTFYEINTKNTELTDSQFENLKNDSIAEEIEVSKIDTIIKNKFIALISGISFFLLILIIIPVIIGLIPLSNFNINFVKFVSINYLIHIICIIIFEVILILGILPFFKTINIKNSSEGNYIISYITSYLINMTDNLLIDNLFKKIK